MLKVIVSQLFSYIFSCKNQNYNIVEKIKFLHDIFKIFVLIHQT